MAHLSSDAPNETPIRPLKRVLLSHVNPPEQRPHLKRQQCDRFAESTTTVLTTPMASSTISKFPFIEKRSTASMCGSCPKKTASIVSDGSYLKNASAKSDYLQSTRMSGSYFDGLSNYSEPVAEPIGVAETEHTRLGKLLAEFLKAGAVPATLMNSASVDQRDLKERKARLLQLPDWAGLGYTSSRRPVSVQATSREGFSETPFSTGSNALKKQRSTDPSNCSRTPKVKDSKHTFPSEEDDVPWLDSLLASPELPREFREVVEGPSNPNYQNQSIPYDKSTSVISDSPNSSIENHSSTLPVEASPGYQQLLYGKAKVGLHASKRQHSRPPNSSGDFNTPQVLHRRNSETWVAHSNDHRYYYESVSGNSTCRGSPESQMHTASLCSESGYKHHTLPSRAASRDSDGISLAWKTFMHDLNGSLG